MRISSSIEKRIITQGALTFEFLASGDIFRIVHGNHQINLLRGNLIDGQAANIYLRVTENHDIKVTPLLGLNAYTKVAFKENQVVYQGKAFGADYQVTLTVLKDRWYYDVFIPKTNAFETFDLVYGQDVGIASIWSVLSSEAYTAQYIDHAIYKDDLGYIIQSRQNQGDPQFLQLGGLNKVVGYATDGFQVFKTNYKITGEIEGLKADLPNKNYQYEFPYLSLQSEKLDTKSDQSFTFFGYYEPFHEKIEREKLNVIHQHQAVKSFQSNLDFHTFEPLNIKLLKVEPLEKNYIKAHYKNMRHVELDQSKMLLSFFTDYHVHVVTDKKEASVERQHGHLLISGDLLSGTEHTLATTNWMFGVFASHIVLGNTNIQKLNNDLRNPLNLQKISGLRIYIKNADELTLLGVPNLYEMGINYAKWIYKLKDDTLIITSHVKLNDFGQRLFIHSVQNKTYDFVLTNQLVLGSNEYERDIETIVDGNSILFKMDTNDFVQSKYPNLKYQYVSKQDVKYQDDRVLFGEEKHHGLLTMTYTGVSDVELDLYASFDEIKPVQFDLEKDQTQYSAFIDSLTGIQLTHPKRQDELDQLTDTIFWYTHNALVHFASPHGLEQSNGAAWGTRDVLQGPVELFATAQRFDLVRKIILTVFSRQFVENYDFPQWFMFDKYYAIQAHESHGDIIVWPLKALGDYLHATGDTDILKEAVPYMRMQTGEWVEHESTLLQHVNKTLNAIVNSFVDGASLPAYGGGDWDDTLQPANKKLTDHMVSGWTAVLLYQALNSLSIELEGTPLGRRAFDLKTRIKDDYEEHLIKDGIPAGFAVFEKDGVDYLLHPRDKNTGLKYRLLPLTRSIIAQMVDSDQAHRQEQLIETHLKHPDGVRLMDTLVTYRGGEKTYFQRAETAANFGREIGILYIHAHIRYIEAMAKLGNAKDAYNGLFTINPMNIKKHVKNARIRQANMYFSSSDAAFDDRYQAKKEFERVRLGNIEVKGGWRLYSSGPGIYIHQLITNVLGIRFDKGNLVLDPVLPDHLKGIKIKYHFNQKPLYVTYHVTNSDYKTVLLNGKNITDAVINLSDNIYRKGGMLITKELLARAGETIEISIK